MDNKFLGYERPDKEIFYGFLVEEVHHRVYDGYWEINDLPSFKEFLGKEIKVSRNNAAYPVILRLIRCQDGIDTVVWTCEIEGGFIQKEQPPEFRNHLSSVTDYGIYKNFVMNSGNV